MIDKCDFKHIPPCEYIQIIRCELIAITLCNHLELCVKRNNKSPARIEVAISTSLQETLVSELHRFSASFLSARGYRFISTAQGLSETLRGKFEFHGSRGEPCDAHICHGRTRRVWRSAAIPVQKGETNSKLRWDTAFVEINLTNSSWEGAMGSSKEFSCDQHQSKYLRGFDTCTAMLNTSKYTW